MAPVRTSIPSNSHNTNRSPSRRGSAKTAPFTSSTAAPNAREADAMSKTNIQKRLKLQQKIKSVHLPECISRIAPEMYERYNKLLLYEQSLDSLINKHLKLHHDAWKSSAKNKMLAQSRRKLRVHIFNTYENQPSRDFELNTLQQEDLTYCGPPSWTLKLQGSVIEKDDSSRVCKFTSFFSRIMIITSNETILWDKRLQSADEVDGLEIHRAGDKEHEILILFFLDYKYPVFALSEKLAELVEAPRSSLPGIISCIWEYAMKYNLFAQEGSRRIVCDDVLKQLFEGIESFGIEEIPRLLENHIFPPKPVCISHNLRLHGDWIQNANTYDFLVELLDTYPREGDWSLANNKFSKEQIAIKQQQMDEIDAQVVEWFDRLQQSVMLRNFYKAFSNEPVEFINSLMTSKYPDAEQHLLDESFMADYRIADKKSSYYRQPWVSRSVSKYLQEQHTSFDDQICKVLSSMSIPDPRRHVNEESEFNATSNNRRPRTPSVRNRTNSVKSRRRPKKLEAGVGEMNQ